MRLVVLALVLAPAAALAAPVGWKPLCPNHTCKGFARVDANGDVIRADTPPPGSLSPATLQMMFDVDPTLGSDKTVAIVDAYGYQELESDLATYRAQWGLPACTIASGCLTILNSDGSSSPLDPDPTDQEGLGWNVETALDVDMASAACPLCKIIVIQATGNGNSGLEFGQTIALKQSPDTISDSWGGAEDSSDVMDEVDYNHAGIGTFVSSGDDGYTGSPSYPSTSQYVISVGGIQFDGSGNDEAWGTADDDPSLGGAQSGCSTVIAKQAWAPADSPCGNFRADADIAAFAAPNPGVAVSVHGHWEADGGTSAAAPFSAALFAAAGHGDARPAFVYGHADAFTDVTEGITGACGNVLCNSGAGWDGPTGLGLPDQQKLLAIGNVAGAGPAVMIGYPADGATVQPGFTIEMAATDTAVWTQVQMDGTNLLRLGTGSSSTTPTTLADGAHELEFTSYDSEHNSATASIHITIAADTGGGGGGGGGCSAAGAPGFGTLLALFGLRRRRN